MATYDDGKEEEDEERMRSLRQKKEEEETLNGEEKEKTIVQYISSSSACINCNVRDRLFSSPAISIRFLPSATVDSRWRAVLLSTANSSPMPSLSNGNTYAYYVGVK